MGEKEKKEICLEASLKYTVYFLSLTDTVECTAHMGSASPGLVVLNDIRKKVEQSVRCKELAGLLRGFFFCFCLQVPLLSSQPDFPLCRTINII